VGEARGDGDAASRHKIFGCIGDALFKSASGEDGDRHGFKVACKGLKGNAIIVGAPDLR
jgi:hypothetical protein